MPSDRARPMAQLSPTYARAPLIRGEDRGSERIIPLRPKIARRLPPAPPRQQDAANREPSIAPLASLGKQQSAALRQAVAFARAVMAKADAQGKVDYYDRWGNKVCLKR
jgi:hypothetical protein